jgi:hypothetical protein
LYQKGHVISLIRAASLLKASAMYVDKDRKLGVVVGTGWPHNVESQAVFVLLVRESCLRKHGQN